MTRLAPFALACAAVLVQAGAQSAELRAVVRDAAGAPLADAVVVAEGGAGAAPAPRPAVEQIEQIDLEFVPGVKAIRAGTAVSFPNRDRVRHHVYSFSGAKRFDLPLYAGTPPQPVLFDAPGVVTIGCNIHDWMIGYIYVSASPHFAKSDAAGTALLGGLAPGRYAVRVWHPRLASSEEATQREVEVGPGGAGLEWRLELKPDLRVRRAPARGPAGRY